MGVMPVAPQVDPNAFVFDSAKAMLSAHAGIQLGNELARLGDLGQQLELERKKRKLDLDTADYQIAQIEHTRARLPEMTNAAVDAHIARSAEEAARLRNQTRLQTALGDLRVPELSAQRGQADEFNKLATTVADFDFSSQSTPDQAQTLAASKAAGDATVRPDGTSALSNFKVDPAVAKGLVEAKLGVRSIDIPTVLENGAPGVKRYKVGPSGDILTQGQTISQTGLSPAEMRAEKMVPQIQEWQILDKSSSELEQQLNEYVKTTTPDQRAKDFAAIKAMEANGLLLSPVRAVGDKVASPAAKQLAANIYRYSSTLATQAAGRTQTHAELARLGHIPSIDDMVSPDKALAGLKAVKDYTSLQLGTAEARDAIRLMMGDAAASKPSGGVTLRGAAEQNRAAEANLQSLQSGPRKFKDPQSGKVYEYFIGPDGKVYRKPA